MGRRHQAAAKVMKQLFNQPYITVKHAEVLTGLSTKAAIGLIDAFVRQGWLDEVTGQSRNRMFLFRPYMELYS